MSIKQVDGEFFTKIRSIHSLRAGPAGWVLFATKQADLNASRYKTALYSHKGGKTLLVAKGVSGHWWRGSEIVYATRRTAAKNGGVPLTTLYKMTQGGKPQLWLRLAYNVSDIAFLPSGGFVFCAEHDPKVRKRQDVPQTAAEAKQLQACGVAEELPVWRNGEGFVQGCRQRLYRWHRSRVTPLTDEETDVEHLRLSPEGDAVYCIAAKPQNGVSTLHNSLLRVDVHSGEAQDVSVEHPFCHTAFAVLQKGALLVFGSNLKEYGIMQNGNFYRVLQGGKTKLLYNSGQYDCYDSVQTDISAAGEPRFIPVGDRVYWVSTVEDSSHLMCIDIGSGEITRCTKEAGSVLEIAATGGKLFYTALRGLAGPELYCLEQDGSETCLTHVNKVAQEYEVSVPQLVEYKGSQGTPLRGWVLPPAGCSPRKKYPAVLYIHGGPKSVYGAVLHHEFQYLAAEGFAVLYCNPTGSDGRGNAFADLRGRWGGADCDDLMAFTDTALAAYPWIDPTRLAVAGGSYGGFVVNWLIGYTNRFAAAISQRGIANWVTMATTTDIGYFFVPDQTGLDVWKDGEKLWRVSPISHAAKAKTPTLFLHSDEDYRCFHAESLQMYTALRQSGTPARLCLFHGENHNLSRGGSPQNRLLRLQEILGWLNKYLK